MFYFNLIAFIYFLHKDRNKKIVSIKIFTEALYLKTALVDTICSFQCIFACWY